jgi:hypothetical protein
LPPSMTVAFPTDELTFQTDQLSPALRDIVSWSPHA